MTPDRWDADLPDFVWRWRACIHTRVRWNVAEPPLRVTDGVPIPPPHYGDLDGPAVLGPMAGWLMRCQVFVSYNTASGDPMCAAAVRAARGWDGPQVAFNLGPAAEPAAWADTAAARRSFEDLCRGDRPGNYRVRQGTARWWPLPCLPDLIRAAEDAEAGKLQHPDLPVVERPRLAWA